VSPKILLFIQDTLVIVAILGAALIFSQLVDMLVIPLVLP
jgi:hypothetical protein